MKKYKFKLVRTSVANTAVMDLEEVANEFSVNGWGIKTVLYFKELSSFMLIFEKGK